MDIEGATALVTGANRGLGAAFCRRLLERGATKVYAGARDPASITMDGVTPLRLDVTNPGDVAATAARCRDVNLLVNNAGISTATSVLADDALEMGRYEFETNVFGPLAMSRAFAPVLADNGGGAIINVLSVLAWLSFPQTAIYSASKAAGWSLTNSLRQELRSQNTNVLALHVGLMDTDMTAGLDLPKSSPFDVAGLTLDGIEADAYEVLADADSRNARDALSQELPAMYPALR